MSQSQPTQVQIRNARRQGFGHSTAIIAEPRRSALNASYVKQDTRRERNVSGFYKTIMGSK